MDAQSFLNEELKKIDSFLSLSESFGESEKQISFSEFSLVDLLNFAICPKAFYFESKEEDFAFLGLGISREFNPNTAQSFLARSPNQPLVYQGSFEEHNPLIYLPEWSFVKQKGKVNLVINKNIDTAIFSTSDLLFNHNLWESFISPWTSYEEAPEHDEWEQMINEATRLFKKDILQKIVLSRKKVFTYDGPIDIPVMFRELYEGNRNSSHYTIFHQAQNAKAFISFTPERLFTLKKNKLETISLAGSILRGKTDEEDLLNEETLKKSTKLIREHEIVTREILHKLSSLTDDLKVSPIVTMKLPYIQHRQAVITATLKTGINALKLIELLHPTAAVGGIPQEAAIAKILEIEKGKRHMYAAPVGILSGEFSEIVVGIRSALINHDTVTVYGGAGIIDGSDAEDEWIETGTKMQPFVKVLNKSVI
jgi:menaquinone-specific isochorismate synthase